MIQKLLVRNRSGAQKYCKTPLLFTLIYLNKIFIRYFYFYTLVKVQVTKVRLLSTLYSTLLYINQNLLVCDAKLQTRYVFCKLLATWLCLKPPRSSVSPPQVYRKRESLITDEDSYSNRPQRDITKTSSLETTVESMNKLLVEIRNLLKARAHREDNQLNDDESEEEIKMDWLLAALVLNRICAIGFGVIFVVGTLTFILLIATHYRH